MKFLFFLSLFLPISVLLQAQNVGIGTSSPAQKLHLVNGKIYLQDNRANNSPHVIFDNPAVDYKEGGLQWHRSGDTMASINYVANPTFANYLRFQSGEHSMFYNTSGYLGIGYADPQARLHVRHPDGDIALRLDAINPEIEFRKKVGTTITTWDQVGFLQTTDNKDLRIGTYSGNTTGKFIVRTDGIDRVHVTGTGMGIGTSLPLTNLHLQGGADAGLTVNNNGYAMVGTAVSGATNLIIDNNEIMVRSGYTGAGTLTLQNEGGNLVVNARTAITANGEALKIDGVNPTINFYNNGVFRSFITQDNPATGHELYIGANGILRLDATSQVAIGNVITAANSNYKLAVDGKVVCEELKVKLSGNWPDYVFNNDYKLKSLADLRTFIDTNKHLPGIPAASEMEKNGLQVGEMQRKMMEKVEELTLYILQLEDKINELKSTIKNQQPNK